MFMSLPFLVAGCVGSRGVTERRDFSALGGYLEGCVEGDGADLVRVAAFVSMMYASGELLPRFFHRLCECGTGFPAR